MGRELEEQRALETKASAEVSEWDLKVEKMRQTLLFKQSNVDRIAGEIQRSREELKEILEALRTSIRTILSILLIGTE